MGYWNETCLLTRLPIEEGTPVMAILTAPRPKPLDTCLCDSIYMPISIPVYGHYDGYGRVEYIKATQTATDLLQHLMIRTKTEHQSSHEDPEAILYMVSEHACFTPEHDRIFLSLIRKDFYDFAIDSCKKAVSRDILSSPTFRTRLTSKLRDVIRDDDSWEDGIKDLVTLYAFMNNMRISWTPTCGTGNQNAMDMKWQSDFHKYIARKAKAMYKESK